jgi:hypothetical protein
MSLTRRKLLKSTLIAGLGWSAWPVRNVQAAANAGADFAPGLDVAGRFFDGKQCWVHPRAGLIPNRGTAGNPRVVMTMNTLDLDGSDVFKAMLDLHTDDLGRSWSEPRELSALAPRTETIDGIERPVSASDFWPTWHAASNTLLGTGHSVVYTPAWKVVPVRPRHTIYSCYDAETGAWLPWKKLAMPEDPKFYNAGAGCTQRYDLPGGDILLPFYFKPQETNARVAVMRCTFDGKELRYAEHGDELGIDDDTRGVGEPSLTRFGDHYYLTVRHDRRGYVTRGTDGLHFEPLTPWCFDDGSDLGSYNTQTHWVTHSSGLFLVYTRRGLNNDHVPRHRAPLLMAQVDPKRMCVLRETERAIVPQRGARLGNFGVTDVSPDETWVTVAEWMQPLGCEKYGSDGSIFVARIFWKQPNRLFQMS